MAAASLLPKRLEGIITEHYLHMITATSAIIAGALWMSLAWQVGAGMRVQACVVPGAGLWQHSQTVNALQKEAVQRF